MHSSAFYSWIFIDSIKLLDVEVVMSSVEVTQPLEWSYIVTEHTGRNETLVPGCG